MPTTQTETVGTGGGRTYTTLVQWEDGSSNKDLVTADEVWFGDCFDDGDFGERLIVTGATTDATRYRALRPNDDTERYDIITDTGLVNASTDFTQFQANAAEGFFRITGFCGKYTGVVNCQVYQLLHGRASGCVAIADSSTGDSNGFVGPSVDGFQSCIAKGTGSDTAGLRNGFTFTHSFHCVAYKITQGAGVGFFSGWGLTWQNNISMGCDTDYNINTAGTEDHNLASDTTAAGTGSIDNGVDTDVFEAPGSNDFRLKVGSAAIDAGATLSPALLDYIGITHGTASGSQNMGAYDGFVGGAGLPPRSPKIVGLAERIGNRNRSDQVRLKVWR